MMAALILVTCGVEVDHAFQNIAEARGRPVPDTEEQHAWVAQYAAGLHMIDRLRVAEKMEAYKLAPYASTEKADPEIIDASKPNPKIQRSTKRRAR